MSLRLGVFALNVRASLTSRDRHATVRLTLAQIRMKSRGIVDAYVVCSMRSGIVGKPRAAFTLIEVMAIFGTALLLCAAYVMLKPGGCRLKEKSPRVKCTSGLKQVALGYLLWANEHEGKLPMEVSVSEGGSREDALGGRIVPNFTVVAREISDPRVLRCPSDKRRGQTITFGNLSTNHISYFLNVEAASLNQEQILAGDRDVTTNGSPVRVGEKLFTEAAGILRSSMGACIRPRADSLGECSRLD
jgi:hypothetical protein